MSSQTKSAGTTVAPEAAPLDLTRWRDLPVQLMVAGGLVLLLGAFSNSKLAIYSYLTGYMFFLSLGLGALFLVLIHHLFDAMWSVPLRRYLEHMACLLFPWMAVLFIPIAVFAHEIYPWMVMERNHTGDHALHAKHGYLNITFWYLRVVFVFAVWGWLTHRLRYWSLQQDTATATTSVEGKLRFFEPLLGTLSNSLGHRFELDVRVLSTRIMRVHAGYGIFLFAITLSIAAVDWVKSIEHQWFSTMYGVYYFAGSVWVTLATVYVIGLVLKEAGPLKAVMGRRQFHDAGVLMFAFTVFYAYIHFSQYFLIWNAAIPEETFWYIKREQGVWKEIGYLIVFGHFFVPFLALLRIDAKVSLAVMVPLAVWAWLMHLTDMTYNIMPALPDLSGGPSPRGVLFTLATVALIGGVLARQFIKAFNAHPPYPQRDPRMAETMGVYVTPESEATHGGAK
jgi:hypothetical protein